MFKSFAGFLSGIIVGVLIVAVALVGGGYLLLKQEGTMGKVEDAVGDKIGMDLTEEQEAMSLLDYVGSLAEVFKGLSDKPIKDIEGIVGMTKISQTISDAIGIEREIIAESSISKLGATLTDNLTLTTMSNKFELELPDLPLFQDEEFLAKPVNKAFGDLDQNTLDSFIEVVYEGEGTEEKPESSKLLQKLGGKKLKEVSEDMDGIIQETAIGEVIEITEESAPVLWYLKGVQLNALDDAIQEMKVEDAIKITDDSNKVLKYFADNDVKLNGISEAIDAMKISEAIEITDDSSKVLRYFRDNEVTLTGIDGAIKDMEIIDCIDMEEATAHPVLWAIRNLTLDQMGQTNPETNQPYLQDKIDGVKLGDIVTVDESSAPILKALQNTTIGGLSDAIDDLSISDVFEDSDVGVLALIGAGTKVQEVGDTLTGTVTDTSIYALRSAGLFGYDLDNSNSFSSLTMRVQKNNATPAEVVSDFTNSISFTAPNSNTVSHSVFITDDSVTNTTFRNTVGVIPGFKTQVDITAIATQDASGAYVITPEVISAIYSQMGAGNHYGSTLYVDDDIKLVIDGEFDTIFSVMYADGNGDITIAEGTSFMSPVGGAIVYVANSITSTNGTVYTGESTAISQANLGIATKMIYHDKTDKQNDVTTSITWIEAFNGYSA
ncbi:MAG: hypothetical protein IKA77_00045 [Clostridia bacterium]|nr:hypothetical protein [Clostridia bacterium]